jgi:hypothetical protein
MYFGKITVPLKTLIQIQPKVFNTNESHTGGRFGPFYFAFALACTFVGKGKCAKFRLA